jgi:hypothetical protein
MYLLRAFAVWLVIMAVESAHGTLRELFVAPLIGDLRARQISVFTGSLLLLGGPTCSRAGCAPGPRAGSCTPACSGSS